MDLEVKCSVFDRQRSIAIKLHSQPLKIGDVIVSRVHTWWLDSNDVLNGQNHLQLYISILFIHMFNFCAYLSAHIENVELYQYNAPCYTTRNTLLEIDVLGIQRAIHQPYSTDLAP